MSQTGWKKFVKGSCEETERGPSPSPCTGAGNGDFSGTDARQAYENIVQSEPSRARSGHNREASTVDGELNAAVLLKGRLRHQSALSPVTVKPKPPVPLGTLMRLIECGDYDKVIEALSSDKNLVNEVDQFGWSPLMVAVCAGAEEIVELLLLSGANAALRDKGGQSCLSLARKKGHLNLIQVIKNFRPEKPEPVEPQLVETETAPSSPMKFELCDACNIEIEQSRKKKHLTSTVHQLSRCTKGCKTYYSIPGSNRGYQLMLKNGWDGEQGLGPSGSGMKLPPKTVLKRDRKGLGASKSQARITHFQSNDTKAVARNPPQSSHRNKVQLKQKIRKEKLLEVALRRELS